MLVSGRSGGGLLGEGRYLTAGEAAAELGVSLPTLYSYVSRGMVRSEAAEGGRRSRRYRAEDVRALTERKERRRDPAGGAEGALRGGEGGGRAGRYRAGEGRALKERKERRRDPEGVAEGALRWGAPVLESGITLVDGGGLFYRGRGGGGVGGGAWRWVAPVLESGITFVDGGRLFYRGRDVGGLAAGCGIEEVAALI